MKYADTEVRNFLTKNINKNTIDTYIKLLSLNHSVFYRVMDLLIDYRLTIIDIKNGVTPINNVNIDSYIKTYELQFAPYQQVPATSIDGYFYLTDTLSLDLLVTEGIENTIDLERLDLDDLIPHIAVKDHDNVKSYKDINSLKTEFNSNILPKLLTKFGCTTSLEQKFPVTDIDISNLFSSVTKTYTNPDTQEVHSVKNLGIKLYKELFQQYFGYTNYFNNDNLLFLLYRINERYSKIEISKGISSMILNLNVPDDSVRHFVNKEAMALETLNALPSTLYIEKMIFRLHTLNLSRNINAGFSEFMFIDLMCKNYYQQNNILGSYNEDIKVVMDILIQKTRDFNTLIKYSYELSNQYLVT